MNGDPAAFDAPFFSITAQGMWNTRALRSNADMCEQRQPQWTHSNDGFSRRLIEPWKTVSPSISDPFSLDPTAYNP